VAKQLRRVCFNVARRGRHGARLTRSSSFSTSTRALRTTPRKSTHAAWARDNSSAVGFTPGAHDFSKLRTPSTAVSAPENAPSTASSSVVQAFPCRGQILEVSAPVQELLLGQRRVRSVHDVISSCYQTHRIGESTFSGVPEVPPFNRRRWHTVNRSSCQRTQRAGGRNFAGAVKHEDPRTNDHRATTFVLLRMPFSPQIFLTCYKIQPRRHAMSRSLRCLVFGC